MSVIREPFRLLGRDAISDLNVDVANRQMQVTTAAGTTAVLQLSEPEMASVRWAILAAGWVDAVPDATTPFSRARLTAP